MKNIIYILPGIFFGFILTNSEVISWFRIRQMFLFEEAHIYLIIGFAIIVGAASILILKKLKIQSLNNQSLNFIGKEYNKGTFYGGLIFGIGWAITGACPGPIFAQIGAGEFAAFSTLIGAILGAYLYNIFKQKLPH
jgi:uncharacterized protein